MAGAAPGFLGCKIKHPIAVKLKTQTGLKTRQFSLKGISDSSELRCWHCHGGCAVQEQDDNAAHPARLALAYGCPMPADETGKGQRGMPTRRRQRPYAFSI
jgi:hypothetical protein